MEGLAQYIQSILTLSAILYKRRGLGSAPLGDYMKIYQTKKWLRVRSRILRRDGYQCQLTKRYGKMRQADTVHHIFPVELFPEYTWEEWNLISLSNKMHNACHDRDTHELSAMGIDLLKRTARKRGMEIPERYR